MEIVKIELDNADKFEISKAISARMDQMGISDFADLKLGFDISPAWPLEPDEPTMAKLVVIAQKLGMRLIINGISLRL